MFARTARKIYAVNFARRRRARYLRRDLYRAALFKTDDLGMARRARDGAGRDKIGSTSARAQDKI